MSETMSSYRAYLIGLLGCLCASAQTVLPTIRVSSETAPPGGMAQMKVLLTSPKPITSGGMAMDMSDYSFDSINGIALFSATGDVAGAAVINGSQVYVQFTSPNGTFGAVTDYPLMTVALTLRPSAIPGQVFPVSLNSSASWWQDLLGSPIAFEFKPGSITVGGSVSITNVLPGGGAIAAGGTFNIIGMGFTPNTKVQLNGLKASQIRYVSPTQIQVTVKDAGMLDGTMIQVQNPDKSTDSYFSYMRGVPLGQSTRQLLARTVPVFSINTAFEAVLPSTISPQVNPDYFTAIALQNPNTVSADVTIESHSPDGTLTGSTQVALPSGSRISREVSELLGSILPTGSYLRVVSVQPVQVIGLLGNDRTGTVMPVPVVVISAPAPPPPPAPTGSGGGGKGN